MALIGGPSVIRDTAAVPRSLRPHGRASAGIPIGMLRANLAMATSPLVASAVLGCSVSRVPVEGPHATPERLAATTSPPAAEATRSPAPPAATQERMQPARASGDPCDGSEVMAAAGAAASPEARSDTDEADQIAAELRRELPAMRRCYNRAVAKSPSPTRASSLVLVIGADGLVTEVRGLDPELRGCITAVLKRAQFRPPASGGSIEISYPLNVDPR
jgi:hypothetical protein